MKFIFRSIGVIFIFSACLDSPKNPRPHNLIGSKQMTHIVSSLLATKGIFNAYKTTNDNILKNLSLKNILYKYKVDSLQFITSLRYYEDHPDQFVDILNRSKILIDKGLKNDSL